MRNQIRQILIFLFVFSGLDAMAESSTRPKVNPNPWVFNSINATKPEFNGDEPLTFKLMWQLAPGYHAYFEEFKVAPKNPNDAVVRLQDIRKVVEFDDKFSKQRRQGVEGEGDAYVQIEVPPIMATGAYQGEFLFTYQACASDHCLLPKTLTVPFTAQVQAMTPKLMGQKFNPTDWRIWLTVFLAGLLTSFTPCVFPLIPITLAILGARRENASRLSGFALSLSYVIGIALTYAILGLIAASTGALFGGFLGHPLVAIALAILFTILGFSSLGYIPLEAPAFLRDRLSRQKSQGGLLGAFITGMAAGIVASPCVGPVLAAILTYVAQTQNLALGFALLFVFALGLGQLFLWLGTFSSVQKLLPRSGRWLLISKYIFAISFFGLALFYLQPWLKKIPELFHTGQKQTVEASYAKLPWQPYSKMIRQVAAEAGRPVVIDFYADWCVACKELEHDTFSQPEVQAFKEDLVFLKFDATKESPEFAELRREFEIVGLPHLVFLDHKGHWRRDLTLTGFEKSPEFAARLQKLLRPKK
ncbi:MAG: cytochrome c biogenesis protein CcdA [Bdellovibrionales bacterium]